MFLSYIEPHQQNDLDRYIGPIGSKRRFVDYDTPGDLDGMVGDWKQHLPDYLGCCRSLDHNVGRLLDHLETLGLSGNTVVIYTSDHGCHFRTRNSEYKRSCHEASIRVPLIACGPGLASGRIVEELVSLIDLPPTLLDIADVTPLPHTHGRSLLPLVHGQVDNWPDHVFVQISEDHIGRALRTKRWKYSIWVPRDHPYTSGFEHSGAERYREQCLYDFETDPYERYNLVSDPAYASIRSQLADSLTRCMAEVGEPTPIIESFLPGDSTAISE